MLGKFVILTAAVILAAPIYAGTGGGSSGGGSSTGAAGSGGGGGHGGGAGGGGAGAGAGAGHSAGANGGVGRSSGLGGRASHTDAMHATHLAGDKHSEVEHTTSKSPGVDHHHPYRRGPNYGVWEMPLYINPGCMPDRNHRSWFDCNGPTKSLLEHKS